jgi:hypothetical protein
MKPDVLTMSTVSLAVSVVLGWLWIETHFVTQAAADATHDGFTKDIRTQYLELKIDQFNTELAFIEQAGVANEETRRYELLKFGVQRMTQQLLELDK